MCGILGVVSCNLDVRQWQSRITAGLKTIEHRGPDESGIYSDSSTKSNVAIIFGHVRLSILDITGSRQPMVDKTSGLAIIYNGELYNYLELKTELETEGHTFTQHGDTEVVLKSYKHWGEKCVNKFRGMFAFTIWDANEECVFLARDHFGKKPLFILEREKKLVFSSEIKAILKVTENNITLNESEICNYLLYRYVPGPNTLFEGIKKLVPGSYAVWKKGELVTTRYYNQPDKNPIHDSNIISDPVESFWDSLDNAVSVRMISDVPFGAFLSGGLDSSVIVGLMSRHSNTPVKTFSIGFREKQYSELDYARIVAKKFNTDHHELLVSQVELMDLLPQLINYRDAPVAEPSDIPIYMLAKESRKTVKMVLTGEGSDEILGGYPKHVYERFVRFYQYIPNYIRVNMVARLILSLPYQFRRVKTAIINLGLESSQERLPRWFGALSMNEMSDLVNKDYLNNSLNVALPFDVDKNNSALRKILYFDQTSWLPDNLLERGDRMTMAASLEARMPFLDRNLATLVSSLPDKYRIRGLTTKWILRAAANNYLPKEIINRPKVGFRIPVNEWFKGPMRSYLYDHLTGVDAATRGLFNQKKLNIFLGQHVKGSQNHEKLIWTLLNLEIWCRNYGYKF